MNRKRLLVVDDEPQIGELLSEAFSDEFDVLTAKTGEEAIRKANLDHPNCILMDVMMPQMGGFMLCEILKSIKQTQLIPVLMVSAKPRQEVWQMAREIGAAEYIQKPFSVVELFEVVRRVLKVAPIERRRTPRVKIRIPVIIRGGDSLRQEVELTSETEDVSRYGALVRLPIRLPLGERVEIRQALFSNPMTEHQGTLARVVWSDSDEERPSYRHGFEFLEPSPYWVINQ